MVNKDYEINTVCENCLYEKPYVLSKGTMVGETPCEFCGCYCLKGKRVILNE